MNLKTNRKKTITNLVFIDDEFMNHADHCVAFLIHTAHICPYNYNVSAINIPVRSILVRING